jgi:hypothetical protein
MRIGLYNGGAQKTGNSLKHIEGSQASTAPNKEEDP